VGGGDNAAEEALFLSRFANKIFLIHRRDRLRATKILAEQVLSNEKIIPCWNSIVKKIEGKEKVSGIILENIKTSSEQSIICDGIFIFVGRNPATGFLKGLVKTDESGHIITDEAMCTDKPGIFAAGDCRKKVLRQVITACSEGAIAAYSARKYLERI
jgi:thioredoxin reductase (NADPH)